jgi:hypothetical protein
MFEGDFIDMRQIVLACVDEGQSRVSHMSRHRRDTGGRQLWKHIISYINSFPDHSFYQKDNCFQKLQTGKPLWLCGIKRLYNATEIVLFFQCISKNWMFSISGVQMESPLLSCKIKILLTSLKNVSPDISFISQFIPRTGISETLEKVSILTTFA